VPLLWFRTEEKGYRVGYRGKAKGKGRERQGVGCRVLGVGLRAKGGNGRGDVRAGLGGDLERRFIWNRLFYSCFRSRDCGR
jgi:hypothetical protein